MSTAEILEELPKLTAEERQQLFERLCELQELDLINGVVPTDEEKKALDAALAEYQRDRNPGPPWREALRELGLKSLPE